LESLARIHRLFNVYGTIQELSDPDVDSPPSHISYRSDCGTKQVGGQPDKQELNMWLTTSEAAEQAGVTTRCITKWIAAGRPSAIKRGGRYLVRRSNLTVRQTTRRPSEGGDPL